MIVMVNQQTKTIMLYTDTGVVGIPFSEANDLNNFISSKDNILYVTNAIETTVGSVIQLIENTYPAIDRVQVGTDDLTKTDDTYFLRSAVKGTVVLSGVLDDAGEPLSFYGVTDMKEIDDKLKKLIEESFVLQSMIKSKQLQVVNQAGMRRIIQQHQRETESAQKNRQAQEKNREKKEGSDVGNDKLLDVSIVDQSVDKFIDGLSSMGDDEDGSIVEGHDVIPLDVTGDVNRVDE
tara:strand:- start:117 stop:821 length:705 start_codon:yes stop_codon:yes gene_type:complete